MNTVGFNDDEEGVVTFVFDIVDGKLVSPDD